MNKTTKITAIEMTILHKGITWYVSIDEGYIVISKKPCDELTDEDYAYDDFSIVNGFDRYDGEDYYKEFEVKKVVKMITKAIKRNKLVAGKLPE